MAGIFGKAPTPSPPQQMPVVDQATLMDNQRSIYGQRRGKQSTIFSSGTQVASGKQMLGQ